MIESSFWGGRRVLVTGHTGFKGAWLSLWLGRLGAEVVGYSKDVPTVPSLYEAAHVGEGLTSVLGDVRDLGQVCEVVRAHRPEVVFHLAAQPLVRRSYAQPVETYATNVLGTAHVLEAARRCDDVRVVVNVTSDKIYENREDGRAFREDDRLGGRDPYSSSKACAELVASAYRDSFLAEGPALASVRAGNVIGGGDWGEERLVPDVMRAALEGAPLLIRNPTAVRPWQHVLDPLGGYLVLAEGLWEEPSLAGAWNFGPEARDARPVEWVVERLRSLWGEPVALKRDAGPQPPEAQVLVLDSTKARTELGWAPRWELEEALLSVIQWTRAFQAGADVRAVALDQIAEHEAVAQPS